MYNNIEATVLNSSNTSTFFKPQICVWQGFPLSAYHFITALENLAIKIRNDTSFKEIKIDNKALIISLLADDITMILNDLNSVKSSLVIFKMFHQCSGLKINVEKTQTTYKGFLENDD